MNDITSGIIYCLFALCLIAIFDAIIPDKVCSEFWVRYTVVYDAP